MRYKRVLLVSLSYPGYLGNVSTLPTGLGYIARALRENRIGYDLLDLGLWPDRQERQRLRRRITEFKPDLLGVSMMTLGYKEH